MQQGRGMMDEDKRGPVTQFFAPIGLISDRAHCYCEINIVSRDHHSILTHVSGSNQ